MKTLIWLRNDLRLINNAALYEGLKGDAVVLYLYEEGGRPLGGAAKWWLHHSLLALQRQGVDLLIRRGDPLKALPAIAKEVGAEAVYWNRRYTPHEIMVDGRLKKELGAKSFPGNLLFEPTEIKPYKVFTPFWKACLKMEVPMPLPAPAELPKKHGFPSLSVEELGLLPAIPWDKQFYEVWEPGEEGAWKRLKNFQVGQYGEMRDYPGVEGTSRLSPHLRFGEISPQSVWHEVEGGESFLREIGWREFAAHLLFHHPETLTEPLQQKFKQFRWKTGEKELKAWQQGKTGFPIVDAGMHELWATGWMHNRVRMIAASFLVKDLLHNWREGEEWFWDTLVDADLANNALGWQWVAGCGADAAPYFRVFNPTTQGEKFDPEGKYIDRWTEGFVEPIVDHAKARDEALEEFRRLK